MRQILMGGSDNDLSNTDGAVEYNNVRPARPVSWVSAIGNREELVPADCVISNLKAKINASVGSGSYIFTLMKNGSATSLTCTISSGTECSDDNTTVSLSAGDRISLRATNVPTPTVRSASWSMILSEMDEDGQTNLIGGSSNNLPVGTPDPGISRNYITGGFSWATGASSPTNSQIMRVPRDCTMKDLHVEMSAAPGAGESRTFTVVKNGTATSLACTIADTGTTCNDTSTDVSFSNGDDVRMQEDRTSGVGSSDDAIWGVQVNLDEEEKHMIMGSTDDPPSTTVTEYNRVGGSGETWNTNFMLRQVLAQCCRITEIQVELSVAPGANKSYKFTLANGSTATPLSVTIRGTSTSATFNRSAAEVADFDKLVLQSIPTGTPALTAVAWSFVVENDVPLKNSLIREGVGI